MQPVYYLTKNVTVDSLTHTVFYRESGEKTEPTILLVHGFPSSSHMFRNLITRLNNDFHVVAADLPGFGQTQSPAGYKYTFASAARVSETFFFGPDGVVPAGRAVTLLIHDYGGPVVFRLHHSNPTRVAAFIVQNANAYAAGLAPAFQSIIDYGNDQSEVNERSMRNKLTFETTKSQFLHGMPAVTLVSPDAINSCQYMLNTPGNDAIQLSYFADYNSNIALYDTWQESTGHAGSWSGLFKADAIRTHYEYLDTGHFPLEDPTALERAANAILEHLPRLLQL
ncbi:hypothetical protein HK100_009144 [Physocladia obscura]|uniref:AB hydrolase-1 domain-containing protein n=1 Tax=Physocladia obscura TaxID=109957 RepID=A0AAD5XJG0_9FUNG|nr:hypothetical protein HK100_009144 [Physocladia obscura]